MACWAACTATTATRRRPAFPPLRPLSAARHARAWTALAGRAGAGGLDSVEHRLPALSDDAGALAVVRLHAPRHGYKVDGQQLLE